MRANLEQVKSKMGTRQEELKNANAQIQDVKERQSALMRRRNEADVALRNYKETEAQCQKQCEHLNNLANNRVAAFGQNMPKLRNLIESARWYGEKPIGPLGLFVSLPDKTWAPILRIVLGFLMNSFAITDARDREQLKRFLVDTQKYVCHIFYLHYIELRTLMWILALKLRSSSQRETTLIIQMVNHQKMLKRFYVF